MMFNHFLYFSSLFERFLYSSSFSTIILIYHNIQQISLVLTIFNTSSQNFQKLSINPQTFGNGVLDSFRFLNKGISEGDTREKERAETKNQTFPPPKKNDCFTIVLPLFYHCFTIVLPSFGDCLGIVWAPQNLGKPRKTQETKETKENQRI